MLNNTNIYNLILLTDVFAADLDDQFNPHTIIQMTLE